MSKGVPNKIWDAAQVLSWIAHGKAKPLHDWTADTAGMADAQDQLMAALREGRLSVWATKNEPGYQERVCVDLDFFRREGNKLTINYHGELLPRRPYIKYDGPTYKDAAFDLTIVKDAFPYVPPDLEKYVFDLTNQIAAATGKKAYKKQVKDIAMEHFKSMDVPLSHRAFDAAWRKLPHEVRRGQGGADQI